MKRFFFLALLLAGCAAPQYEQVKLDGIDGQVMLPIKRGDDIVFEPVFLFRPASTNTPAK